MMTGSVQKSKFRETTEKERSGYRGPERGGRRGVRAKEQGHSGLSVLIAAQPAL